MGSTQKQCMCSPFKQRKEVKTITVHWNGACHLTFKLVQFLQIDYTVNNCFSHVLGGCTLQLTLTILKVEQVEKYTPNTQEEILPSSKQYINTI